MMKLQLQSILLVLLETILFCEGEAPGGLPDNAARRRRPQLRAKAETVTRDSPEAREKPRGSDKHHDRRLSSTITGLELRPTGAIDLTSEFRTAFPGQPEILRFLDILPGDYVDADEVHLDIFGRDILTSGSMSFSGTVVMTAPWDGNDYHLWSWALHVTTYEIVSTPTQNERILVGGSIQHTFALHQGEEQNGAVMPFTFYVDVAHHTSSFLNPIHHRRSTTGLHRGTQIDPPHNDVLDIWVEVDYGVVFSTINNFNLYITAKHDGNSGGGCGVDIEYGRRRRLNDHECTGSITGDPHQKTWAGRHWDNHGECDLVMIAAPSAGIRIHARTQIQGKFSFIASVAIQLDDDVLEIGGWGQHLINGVDCTGRNISHFNISSARGQYYPVEHSQVNEKLHSFVITLGEDEGGAIHVSTHKEWVSVTLKGPSMNYYFGDSVGILGSFPRGTMLARDGKTRLGSNTTRFAEEWQVRDTEPQLFESIRAPQYPATCIYPISSRSSDHRRLTETLSREEAAKACDSWDDATKDDCIYDVMKSGDLEMAEPGSY